MQKRTPLYEQHLALGAKMVDFGGWAMPVNYGSQVEEHLAVRSDAGMFDVSHMTIVDVSGANSEGFLRHVLANDVKRLSENQALYSLMLNETGGVIDDLIVYKLKDRYRCVFNGATESAVRSWITGFNSEDVVLNFSRMVMIALQGPRAIESLLSFESISGLEQLKSFFSMQFGSWLIARTGYTGEDGLEIMLPEQEGMILWRRLIEAGVKPAGLGARDTLRLEAGLNLYGQDMDEKTKPAESNLNWTIAWDPSDREFIGRAAIEKLGKDSNMKLTGLVMREKSIPRQGLRVLTKEGEGVITSGTFSPTFNVGIGLARIPKMAKGDCQVEIRGKARSALIYKPPFFKRGRSGLGL